MRGAILIAAVLAGGGCTLNDGAWFAELKPRMAAAYRGTADRMVDGRFQRLANGHEVAVDRAELRVGSVDLFAAGGAATFDPAHPPAGYSLCHGGHCHADDGRLVPYAEIQAELAGGADGGDGPLLSLGGGSFDLLAPRALALDCPDGCRLGLTHIVRAEASVTALHLEGVVRSGPGAATTIAERTFSVDLPGPGVPGVGRVRGALDLPADNRHAPSVVLDLSLDLGPALFDGLDWTTFPGEPGPLVLAQALTGVPLTTHLQREELP